MKSTLAHHAPRLGRLGLCSLVVLAGSLVSAARAAETDKAITVTASRIHTQQVVWKPGAAAPPSSPFAPRGPGCASITSSVANQFNSIDVGSEITLQAGMVQGEGFGSTYLVADPIPGTTTVNEAFPIEVNLVEFIAGTAATLSGSDGSAVRLGWSIELWDGEPYVGTSSIVFSVESDPDPSTSGLPGDLLLQRVPGASPCNELAVILGGASASAGKLQFSVDQTADPQDRMLVPGNATDDGGNLLNTFTVVVRIVHHNVPGGSTCASVDMCNNVFLATEGQTNTLTYPSRNWLVAVNCPGGAPAGYTRFSALSSSYRPTRDVVQQVTYTPAFCVGVPAGACCAVSGVCSVVTQSACTGSSAYQGDSTVCNPNPCPQPVGACCTAGACTVGSSASCSGVYQGNTTTCATATCPQPTGACCFGTGCLTASTADCASAGGAFQGDATACTASACPTGACCTTNTGACSTATPAACSASGGAFRGTGVACNTTTCPPPTGACCAPNNFCLSGQTELDCTSAGLAWRGGGTVCSPNPCEPSTGTCCRGALCATGVAQSGCTAPSVIIGAAFVAGGSACNTAGNAQSPCCYADFNKQSGISVQDIFDYLNAWLAASPYCKIGGNGADAPVVQDIFEFLNLWLAGGC